ncbi:C2 family cysteine protease [Myxococcus eversor]|uniref:C2 family cysteine protease n=1 Tax=Myxococcus eversor TaxID=2709661 RepID=UPI0013D37684|nr:C2 family cysteine protease [Myxococcus eversor]
MSRHSRPWLPLLSFTALLACGLPPTPEELEGSAPVPDDALAMSHASLIGLDGTGTKVVITGTASADTAAVSYYPNDPTSIIVTLNGTSSVYWLNPLFGSAITSISFSGGDGNDTFTNNTALPCTANGGNGDDVLNGGSGDDFLTGDLGVDTLNGNAGADVLWGSGGSDILYGGTGRDTLYGHGGNDEMHGGDDADLLNGGSGNDLLYGDNGQDTLITVGLGADIITGGNQWDSYWGDATDSFLDLSALELSLGYVHVVSAFHHVSYNGGGTSTPVGLDPLGEELLDPTSFSGDSGFTLVKQDYSGSPLFGPSGPGKNDIFQGTVGDCYFVAALSAIANSDPEFIRNMVVALGDGSYAVRFYRDGDPVYVRVDGDLWVNSATNGLQYAKLGSTGALWVPIVEKAYAIMRSDSADYSAIDTGDGTLEINKPGGGHINLTITHWSYADGVTKEDVLGWLANGSPSGPIMTARNLGVDAFLAWVQQQRAQGAALVTGSVPNVSDTATLDANSWRRGAHILMIDRVVTDRTGKPVGIVLRNPYGFEVELRDYTQIYFLLGGAGRWDLP